MGKKRKKLLSPVLTAVVVTALLLWFFSALGQLGSGQAREGKLQLETALRRAAAACYAAEGIYPPNLEYLESHYGIRVDEGRYAVIYNVFGSNLMPDITVLERTDEKNRK